MATGGIAGRVESVPVIYTRAEGAVPLKASARVIAGIVGASCLAVLVIAVRLRPDATGTGTHRQLGFAACEVKALTWLSCPSLRVSTAVSYISDGCTFAATSTQ